MPRESEWTQGTRRYSSIDATVEQRLYGETTLVFNSKRLLRVMGSTASDGLSIGLGKSIAAFNLDKDPLYNALKRLLETKAIKPQTIGEQISDFSYAFGTEKIVSFSEFWPDRLAYEIAERSGKPIPKSLASTLMQVSLTRTDMQPFTDKTLAEITNKVVIDDYGRLDDDRDRTVTEYQYTQHTNYTPLFVQDQLEVVSGIAQTRDSRYGFTIGIDVAQQVLGAEQEFRIAETPEEARVMLGGFYKAVSALRRFNNKARG